MIHPQYLHEGSKIEIPELSGHVPQGDFLFTVVGVHVGGMGICVHLKHNSTGTQYALKGVRPELFGYQVSQNRFLDELQVWLSASMNSFIAEAIAVVSINETPCVLATWMQKGDLANNLSSFNNRQKIETLIRMVRGLSWVYSNLGVIHRDLKPANVLIDQDNLAYVADWGLARPVGNAMASVGASLSGEILGRPDRTQVGSFLGTVLYAAPEQILGAADIDHRSDIYALGCMMFEFETGHPPFTGQTVADIARQHIYTQPPTLGGWFKRTDLGLEKVISRCLEKNPASRYSTYEELDNILVGIAKKHGVCMVRCEPSIRYERSLLGKGHKKQNLILDEAPVKGTKGLVLVEFSDVAPFFKEAENLIELKRFEEAEKLLQPAYIPEVIESTDNWCFAHSIALNYAYCLMQTGRIKESIAILSRLSTRKNKPAELYINYSLVLIKVNKWETATDLCNRGLYHFPNDPDLMGNLTISLVSTGELDRAQESAIKRLKVRRDIHAIEEYAGVLQGQAKAKRDIALPDAISYVKSCYDLIKEGLILNPRFFTLRLMEIKLCRFACDTTKVVELSQRLMNTDDCPLFIQQQAFAESIEMLANGESFKSALELLRPYGDNISERLLAARMRILARHFMTGKDNSAGQRIIIPEVRDYYLEGIQFEVPHCDPVVAAEVLEWLNDTASAIEVLEQFLSNTPNDWDGIKTMALVYQRAGDANNSLRFVQMLPDIAPWRAESYDWLGYVADKFNRNDIAQKAKLKGDEVFSSEEMLFDDLRAYLDA